MRRPPQNLDERLWFPDEGRITAPGLSDVDAVINFCGACIAHERWSQQRKELLRSSRLNPTTTIVAALEPDGRCKRLLNGSAVGFYGNTGETMIDEGSPRGTGFLADLCADWEQAAQAAPVPTVTLRTGQVLTEHGGFLGKQKLAFQLGLGGRIGSGRQFLAWIHIDDYTRLVEHLLTATLHPGRSTSPRRSPSPTPRSPTSTPGRSTGRDSAAPARTAADVRQRNGRRGAAERQPGAAQAGP